MRIVIADHHPLVADALTQYLRSIDPSAEIAAATTLRGALARLGEGGRAQLVLLDPDLPDAEGLSGLTRVREAFPSVPVVIVTGSGQLRAMRRALELGAAGVIPKTYSPTAIIKALEFVLAGERHVPASLLDPPMMREERAGYGRNGQDPLARLSPHERRVMPELAKGLSNAEIGAQLGITPAGVAYHLKSIFKKLGVANRGRAIALYHELHPPPAED